MARPDFVLDDRELREFSQILKIRRPTQIVAIEREVMNDQAFAVRSTSLRTVSRMFILRGGGQLKWAQSSILVDKAKGRNIRTMFAEVGSKKNWARNKGEPFMGLRYQEFGESRNIESIPTTASRTSSDRSKVVRAPNRFNRLGQIIDESQYPGNSETRVIAMLRSLAAENYKGAFFIRTSSKFKKGIYKFSGKARRARTGRGTIKDVTMIKDLSKNRVRMPKRPWLFTSVRRALSQSKVADMYRKQFVRYTRLRSRSRNT